MSIIERLSGSHERGLRLVTAFFRVLSQTVFTLFLYALGALVLGIALIPAAGLWLWVWREASGFAPAYRIAWLSFTAAGGYFLFGLTLIFVAGAFRFILGLRVTEGEYPIASSQAVRWYVSNALVTLVFNVFGDFMVLTPFIALLYRLMGARLGRHIQINSKFCADLCLLEIGDHSVIGGHATVIAHIFERGRLVLRRVKIGQRVVIGLNAVVMPGCEIGDGSIVAAGAVLPKNSVVPSNSVYSGVPAKLLSS